MKRLVVLGGLMGVVSLFAANACNRTTNAPLGKVTVEPDTVIGDTTFYSYAIRESDRTTAYSFATIKGFWYARPPHSPGQWVPVRSVLSVLCAKPGDAAFAEAERLVRQIGGTVRFRTDAPYGVPWFSVALSEPADRAGEQHAPADLPLLDHIATLDQHRDVIRAVWPITDDVEF